MKVKMKFDLASIKNWLLAHGEKVAFGVVGIVFLLFVYSATQRETLDDQYAPEKMTQLASTVDQHVRASTWDPAREEVKVVNYAERAKTKAIPVGMYALPRAFNPPVTDPKAKRGLPTILPPEELRVAAGMDILRVAGEKADPMNRGQNGQLKAQPWAVVTALVPIEKQREAFASVFTEALEYDRNRDAPKYLKPILERAEVNPAKPDELTWTAVANPPEPRSGTDVVPAKYVYAPLTAPLEELVGGQWGESVSHPKIPLIGEAVEERPQPGAAAPPAAQPGEREPEARAGGPAPNAQPTSDVVAHVLLRAFDYGVQPGKKYRYRVTLALANPNAGMSPMYLIDPQNAQQSELKSEPAGPTTVVTIPDGHDVLAGVIDPGTRYREPTAKILVTSIDQTSGLKAATEIDAHRGSVANTPPHEVKVRHPLDKNEVTLNLGFKSNIMVLDIYGGNDLPGRRKDPPITEPGEILLLDPSGNMTVRSEIDDHVQYEASIVRPEPPKARALEEDEKDKEKNKKPIGGRQRP